MQSDTSFNDLDVRTKLAQAAASHLSHLDRTEAATNGGSNISRQSASNQARPYGYEEPVVNLQPQIQPQLRADTSTAPAADMMSTGPSGAGPSSSAVSAMAVQDLIDHDPDDVTGPDGRKAKRELSQSKRAAQNRAAQRAFRQRKEHYIKKLEQQVRDYNDMDQQLKAAQSDNFALRDYAILLQSRLMDAQVEVPQPPHLHTPVPYPPPPPRAAPVAASRAAEPPTGIPSAGTLADVAAAVAGYQAHGAVDGYSKFKAENDHSRREEDARKIHEPLPPSSSLRT
ncbi:hypothetical protein BKA67DRAFT_530794 [Truncatella angustata]|uniref:Putative transcription factor kapC n=1 Tax=Truncatella angustata TaxID=152316 RepID=A0A9P9A2H3_9PEZI|nr:uncharacterized protein BKA67DRAFT_530794 [Truncatella angustata]KAH6660706.1 hypothetical protein BKA67DRAFT_530794 [Truncatella angustata]